MAQHRDLKTKGGVPDHQMSRNHALPPPLSIKVLKIRDLPNKSNPWSHAQLPVDILLLTTEDCEFLACFAFLKNSFKTYYRDLGYVYFGTMGESKEEALTVALMRCSEGSSGPGGTQIVIKKAVMRLRPKAAFSVGQCMGLNPELTKLGDVVVSSKLSTEQFTTPVRRNLGNLNLFSTEGWKPPLKDPVGEETVQVHRDSEIFSGSQFINKQSRMSQTRVTAAEREGEGKILEKLRFTFMPNSRREFVLSDKFSPCFPLTLYCFYTKISSFMPVLTIGVVWDCFYLLIFYSENPT